MPIKGNLGEIAKLFFKLGTIAFGGPAAHIAMMEDEVVKKRKWMTGEHFLDLVGATNLIPGPNSTEMTMHCGHERAGWKGLFTAGVCFIFPAVVITVIFAWLYKEYGQLPKVEPFIYGIKPAVIAIILLAGYRLSKKAIKSIEYAALGLLTIAAVLMGVNEIIALFGCGLLGLIWFGFRDKTLLKQSFMPLLFLQTELSSNEAFFKIFLTFLKIGAILYGSGYVLLAYLDAELVSQDWISRELLLDAVAVGQMTPGPVLTTASFIGFHLYGIYGAIAATLGIFLPSFLFVLILNPLIPKMRNSKWLSILLNSVNVAAVALIFAICIQMALDTLLDWRSITIALVSIIVVFSGKKINNVYIVIGGAILGYLLSFIS